MLKRFEAHRWMTGAMVPMILAGCSTTSPTATPASQPERTYVTQGGVAQPEAAQPEALQQPAPAANPCGECPSVVPFGAGLQNLAALTAHPVLDYSWYHARGNFAAFGWAPGFYANLQNFRYYPTASGYWPYAYDHARAAYTPYSTVFGGRTVYPYLGLGGGLLGAYAGLERRGRVDRDRDRDRDDRDDRDGDTGQGGPGMGQGQGPGMGQGQDQGQAMAQGQGQPQGQGGSY